MANVAFWSKTAGPNGSSDPDINFAEGQQAGTLNNSDRAAMAAIARWRDDTGGQLVTTGSSNAYLITSNSGFTALSQIVDGTRIHFVASFTNTGAATLNIDTLGAKAIRKGADLALTGGEIVSGAHYAVQYDESANSAAGAWLMLNSSIASAFDIVGLTAETTPAADDSVPIYDLSATANRKMALSDFFKTINVLTAETTPTAADLLALYDASAGTADKITLSDFFKAITTLTAETTPAADDELALYDTSAATGDKITLANLFKVITALTAETTLATDDEIPIYDLSETAANKITVTDFFEVINAFSEDTAPAQSADFLVSYDTSATTTKKVALSRVGIGEQTVNLLAAGMKSRTTNGATSFSTELATNDIMVSGFEFSASVEQAIQIMFPLPKGFNSSATIPVKFYWTTGNTAGTGNVIWGVRARYARDDDALDAAFGTAATVTDAFLADDDLHITSEVALTPGGTYAAECMLVIELYRDADDVSDTYTQTAVLIAAMAQISTSANTDD